MKRRMVAGFMLLVGVFVLAGCSTLNFGLLDRLGRKADKEVVVQNEAKPVTKTLEEVAAEITELTDQSVAKVHTGNWKEAITVMESAYSIYKENESAIRKDPVASQNFISIREKLCETIVEAYDYKHKIDSLSDQEKERYIRTAKEHLLINPADPYKKLEYSRVLLEMGKVQQGYQLAAEVYNSPVKSREITENYAWALYLIGKKTDAYKIYRTTYSQSETLNQLYHSAVVIEDYDKLLGLTLYKACIKAGNNLMVTEVNVKNIAAQGAINSISTKAQKAIDRLLVGGFRVDSKFDMTSVDSIVKSIVRLTKV